MSQNAAQFLEANTLYVCRHCKNSKPSAQFAGRAHVVCKTCQRRLSSPKRLLLIHQKRLATRKERHPEHCGPHSKKFKRLIKLITDCERRACLSFFTKRRAAGIRGQRIEKATPSWIKESHFIDVIADCQKADQETGEKHHIDHIIPLAGVTASGLHVPWNLQVLEARANCSKGNRLVPGTAVCAFPNGDNPLFQTHFA